jgi:hypothetical protein
MADSDIEKESLKEEMQNIVEEARMVIPGVQMLFGFQTIAVFNNRFESLPLSGVYAHMTSLGLLVLSMALLMAPAGYHRLAERGQVSRRMVKLSSRLITAGMVPLMLALTADVYEVVLAAMDDSWIGVVSAAAALGVLLALWFILPIGMRMKLGRPSRK